MLDKDAVAELISNLNNQYVATGLSVYSEAYNAVVYQIPKTKRGILPMRALPVLVSKREVLELMGAPSVLEYETSIAFRAKIRSAEQVGKREAIKYIKNISWWRRMWKQF